MELRRNLDILFGLCATKKCAPVLGEISDTGLGAMVDKVIKDNEGIVHISADALSNKTESNALLPIWGLSPELQEVIIKVADSLPAPRDFITASMFVAAGCALGADVQVFDGHYTNKANLWVVLCATPSSQKTNSMKWIIKPFIDEQERLNEVYEEQHAQWEADRKDKEVVEGDEPKEQRVLVKNSSTEALCEVIKSNRTRLLKYVNEASTFFGDFGKRDNGAKADLGIYIDMRDGEPLDNVLVTRKAAVVYGDYCVSFLGSIQPLRVAELLKDTSAFIGSGFLQRIILINSIPVDTHYPLPPTPKKELEYWYSYCRKLGNTQKVTLTFSADAEREYYAFCNYTIEQQKKLGTHPVSEMLAKQRIYIEQWALITHFLAGNTTTYISGDEMRYSVECMKILADNWEQVFKIITKKKNTMPQSFAEVSVNLWNMLKKRGTKHSQNEYADFINYDKSNFSRDLKKYS